MALARFFLTVDKFQSDIDCIFILLWLDHLDPLYVFNKSSLRVREWGVKLEVIVRICYAS